MYRLNAKVGSKGQGASASSHADYILREGKYSIRQDLQEIGYGNMPNFVGSDPREFWYLSDLHEGENRTVYREIELTLPIESTKEHRKELVDEFVNKHLNGHAFTYAIHDVEGNPHAHVMFCDRKHDGVDRETEQFFKRANKKEPAKGGCAKAEEWNGKDRASHILKVRESWASIENDYFKRIGSAERVDHRTLEAQRIEILDFAKALDDMGIEPEMVIQSKREAARLDRPADQRISSRRWKMMERNGELEEVRESRRANRELAEAKAKLIELGAMKPVPQHVVVEPKPSKTELSPLKKPEIEKIQEVANTPDTHQVEDPRPLQGHDPTTISSSPVLPVVPEAQSEALPPVKETNLPPQQPALDLPAVPALTSAELAYHAVLRRIAEISREFIGLYKALMDGTLLGGVEKYNDQTDQLDAKLDKLMKPYPTIEISLPYDDTPIMVNGQPITEMVKELPPEPIQISDVKPQEETKLDKTKGQKR